MTADFTSWVIDTSFEPQEGSFCFCPYIDGQVCTGLSIITENPPGKVIGLFHPDSQHTLEDFKTNHIELLKQFGVS